ncbi:ensconsin isoform X14 [Drosophila gunungcola]|uniref:ensconsin isoform X14 n=1 Tax=Drosophila gunungcola TaxID=103775 RepID=UPI0022E6805F|nr:ensconsin isoform X14 [Drosophila gunungcola]
MASLGGQHENISNNPEVENTSKRSESREGSAERKAHALAPEKISNCSAGATLHWFAQVGGQIGAKEDDSQASKDREEKLKYARDRQNEERHRKIEELRAQAEAAQRYREQKEEERRRRIEEIRVRDTEKRHQVEERKKAIFEAEKERREYILKKNQERESRIEVKRRDRNSIGFAFGSSTPRLLDVPADYGLVSPSAFWGQRRSTSISNVAGASLSRRSSERELADSGAKKRASSSTDRQDGSRSGNATPGGHFNSSRPGSAMSTSTNMSTSGLVPRRPATAPRKPRPASIAGTGMSLEEINKLKRDQKPPVKTTAASPSAQTTPKRTANLMSTSLIVTSSSSRLSSAEKKTPSKREPPVPKAASASKALPSRTASSERISRLSKEPKTKDNSAMTRSMIVTSSSSTTTTTKAAPAPAPAPAPVPVSAPAPEQNGMAKEVLLEKTAAEEPVPEAAPVPIEAPVAVPSVSKAEKEALNSEKTEEVVRQVEEEQTLLVEPVPEALIASINVEEKSDEGTEKETAKAQEQAAPKKPSRSKENSEVRELTPPEGADLMTASMMAKKITTEEEAKAALAERRRLAREEAERQAELERQRLEAERLAEIKAQEEEAERQRLFEEESTRLAEEQRRGEEERLRKAIEEAQQREEEEKRKREDEEKQRVEREEAEKKAKEEAEKQRVEVAERLKREEKEREERRKRVEAIMLRTRKGGAATTPSKDANDKAAPAASAPENNSSSNSSVSGSSNNSAEGSPSTADSTPAPTATETETVQEPPNSQAMYEQSVLDKENSLINSFSTMIIDENAKNLQQVSNGKLLVDFEGTNTVPAVANGNGHIENVNNKNDINLLQDAVGPVATQLIDLSIESQDLHLNNNNSLLTSTAATTTLVTADSHENKDISLL